MRSYIAATLFALSASVFAAPIGEVTSVVDALAIVKPSIADGNRVDGNGNGNLNHNGNTEGNGNTIASGIANGNSAAHGNWVANGNKAKIDLKVRTEDDYSEDFLSGLPLEGVVPSSSSVPSSDVVPSSDGLTTVVPSSDSLTTVGTDGPTADVTTKVGAIVKPVVASGNRLDGNLNGNLNSNGNTQGNGNTILSNIANGNSAAHGNKIANGNSLTVSPTLPDINIGSAGGLTHKECTA